jgi:ribose transport system substrate-binding protein
MIPSPWPWRGARSFAVLTMALAVVGCSSGTASQAPASQAPASQAPASQAPASQAPASQAPASQAPASQKAWNIAFIPGQVGVAFFTSMQCGAEAAAKQYGVNLTWQGAPQWDITVQMPIILAALQRHPDGMILDPNDPVALVSTVQNAGIPVVTVDGNLSQPVDVQNIRTNNITAGGLAADALAAAIKGTGKVLVLALNPGIPANQERVDGFVNELKAQFPKVTVLPTQYIGVDQTKAAEVTSATIQANPDLAAIYTTNSFGAGGASSAVVAAGKQGKIKIVAYDADPDQVTDLKNGIYDALVVQAPYLEGYDSVQLLVGVLNKSIDPATLPRIFYPPMVIATRDNLNTPDVQKLLYSNTCS